MNNSLIRSGNQCGTSQSFVDTMVSHIHSAALNALVDPTLVGAFPDGDVTPCVLKSFAINCNLMLEDGKDRMLIMNLNCPTKLGYVYVREAVGWKYERTITSVINPTQFSKARNVSVAMVIVCDTITTTNSNLSGNISCIVMEELPDLNQITYNNIASYALANQMYKINVKLWNGLVLRNVVTAHNPYVDLGDVNFKEGELIKTLEFDGSVDKSFTDLGLLIYEPSKLQWKITCTGGEGTCYAGFLTAPDRKIIEFNNSDADAYTVKYYIQEGYDVENFRFITSEGGAHFKVEIYSLDPILSNLGAQRHVVVIQGNAGTKNLVIAGNQSTQSIPHANNYSQINVTLPITYSPSVFELFNALVAMKQMKYVFTRKEYEYFMNWYYSIGDEEIAYATEAAAATGSASVVSVLTSLIPLYKSGISVLKKWGIKPADILRKGINFLNMGANGLVNYLESNGYASTVAHAETATSQSVQNRRDCSIGHASSAGMGDGKKATKPFKIAIEEICMQEEEEKIPSNLSIGDVKNLVGRVKQNSKMKLAEKDKQISELESSIIDASHSIHNIVSDLRHLTYVTHLPYGVEDSILKICRQLDETGWELHDCVQDAKEGDGTGHASSAIYEGVSVTNWGKKAKRPPIMGACTPRINNDSHQLLPGVDNVRQIMQAGQFPASVDYGIGYSVEYPVADNLGSVIGHAMNGLNEINEGGGQLGGNKVKHAPGKVDQLNDKTNNIQNKEEKTDESKIITLQEQDNVINNLDTPPADVQQGSQGVEWMEYGTHVNARQLVNETVNWRRVKPMYSPQVAKGSIYATHSLFMMVFQQPDKENPQVLNDFALPCMINVTFKKPEGFQENVHIGAFHVESRWQPDSDTLRDFNALILTDPKLSALNTLYQGEISVDVYISFTFAWTGVGVATFDGGSWFAAFYAAMFAPDPWFIVEGTVVSYVWKDEAAKSVEMYCSWAQVGMLTTKISSLLWQDDFIKAITDVIGGIPMIVMAAAASGAAILEVCGTELTCGGSFETNPSKKLKQVYIVGFDTQNLTKFIHPAFNALRNVPVAPISIDGEAFELLLQKMEKDNSYKPKYEKKEFKSAREQVDYLDENDVKKKMLTVFSRNGGMYFKISELHERAESVPQKTRYEKNMHNLLEQNNMMLQKAVKKQYNRNQNSANQNNKKNKKETRQALNTDNLTTTNFINKPLDGFKGRNLTIRTEQFGGRQKGKFEIPDH